MALVDLGEEFLIKNNAVGSQTYRIGLFLEDTPFSISNAEFVGSFDLLNHLSSQYPKGMAMSANGDMMQFVYGNTSVIYQTYLSDEYNVTSTQSSYDTYDSSVMSEGSGCTWSHDGFKFFVADNSDRDQGVYVFDVSTAYDITTVTSESGSDLGHSNKVGLDWDDTGDTLYILDDTFTVHEYTCSTSYDPSTASLDQSVTLSTTYALGPWGFEWNGDGSKFFIYATEDDSGTYVDKIIEFSCSTKWDTSTHSKTDEVQITYAESFTLANGDIEDGSTLYHNNHNNGYLRQYQIGQQTNDTMDTEDFSTEPIADSYARESLTSYKADDVSGDWAFKSDETISFDLSGAAGRANRYFITAEFQASDTGDGSSQEHLIAFGSLGQVIDLNSVDTLSIDSGTIGYTVN